MSQPVLTPHHLVITARVLLGPCLCALFWIIARLDMAPHLVAMAVFLTSLVLLQAAPRLRASDLLGALALFVTMAAWVHKTTTTAPNGTQWQSSVFVIGAVVLLLKVQHWRALARQDAYVPLRHLDRRSALFARSRRRSRPRQPQPEAPASLPMQELS